ncbi:endonuclease V [Candidatus Pacearchaeota archaeon]|nr:endonuclease V [Candidatus Pacearchaeota archaeon]
MEETKGGIKMQELIKKYNINLEELEKEQIKLAKGLEIKDKIDFNLAETFGAIDNTFIGNKLLSCIIVCNRDMEIIDKTYAIERVKFPYIPGFRNYREMPTMVSAYDKLNEKPDLIFVNSGGIIHPRLGLASHFGLALSVPTIGISNSAIDCEIKDNIIYRNNKKVGRLLLSKEGSNPLYISPGNLISVDSAYDVCKLMIQFPHKNPEPLHLASKYTKEVRRELV